MSGIHQHHYFQQQWPVKKLLFKLLWQRATEKHSTLFTELVMAGFHLVLSVTDIVYFPLQEESEFA